MGKEYGGDVPLKPVGGHWVDLRGGGWCSPNLPSIPEYPGTRKILGGLGGVGSCVPPRSYVMDIAPLLLSYWNFWPFQNICFACLVHKWYIYVTGLFNYSLKSILGGILVWPQSETKEGTWREFWEWVHSGGNFCIQLSSHQSDSLFNQYFKRVSQFCSSKSVVWSIIHGLEVWDLCKCECKCKLKWWLSNELPRCYVDRPRLQTVWDFPAASAF